MKRASILASLFVAVALLAPTPGFAQSSAAAQQAQPDINASIVTTAPNQSAASREAWFQEDMEYANQRSRRSRNALIGTSAAFGLGAILTGVGFSQCQDIPNQSDLLCNDAGNALLGVGGTIAGLSAIGMITSGIILGVANKRKREIQRDFRRGYYGRRLQWDVPSGGLAF